METAVVESEREKVIVAVQGVTNLLAAGATNLLAAGATNLVAYADFVYVT